MPTYDYRCKKCGFEFEEFQSIVSAPLTQCPQCEGEVERLIAGGAGLIFKGSGFYLTDYKNKSSSSSTSSDKSSSSKPKESSSTKESS